MDQACGGDCRQEVDGRSLEQFKTLLRNPGYRRSELLVTEAQAADMQRNRASCPVCKDSLFRDGAAPFACIKCPGPAAHVFHLGCFIGPSGFLRACPVCRHGCGAGAVRFYVRFALLHACQCMGSIDQQTVQRVFSCWKRSVGPASFSKELARYRFIAPELEVLRHFCSIARLRLPWHDVLAVHIALRLRVHARLRTGRPVLHRLLNTSAEIPVCAFSSSFVASLSAGQVLALAAAVLRSQTMHPLSRAGKARAILSHVKHSRDMCFREGEMCALLRTVIETDSGILLSWLCHGFPDAFKFPYQSVLGILRLYLETRQGAEENEAVWLCIFLTSGSRFAPQEEKTIADLMVSHRSIGECCQVKTGEFFDKLREFRRAMDGTESDTDAVRRMRLMMTNTSVSEFQKMRFLFPRYGIWRSSSIFKMFPADLVCIAHCMEILEHGIEGRDYGEIHQALQALTHKAHYTHRTFMLVFNMLGRSSCRQAIYFLFTLTGHSTFQSLRANKHTDQVLAEVVRLALFVCIPYLEEYAADRDAYDKAAALYRMQILRYDVAKLKGFVCEGGVTCHQNLRFYYRNFDLFLAESPAFRGCWRDETRCALLGYFADERFSTYVGRNAVGGIFRVLSRKRDVGLGLEMFFGAVASRLLRRCMKLEILRAVVPRRETGPGGHEALFPRFVAARDRIGFLLCHCRSFMDYVNDRHAEALAELLDETSSGYLLILLKTSKTEK